MAVGLGIHFCSKTTASRGSRVIRLLSAKVNLESVLGDRSIGQQRPRAGHRPGNRAQVLAPRARAVAACSTRHWAGGGPGRRGTARGARLLPPPSPLLLPPSSLVCAQPGSPTPGFLLKMASPVAAQARKLLRDLALRPPLLAPRSQVSGPCGRGRGQGAWRGARLPGSSCSSSSTCLLRGTGARLLECCTSRGDALCSARGARGTPASSARVWASGPRGGDCRGCPRVCTTQVPECVGIGSPSSRPRRLALYQALQCKFRKSSSDQV